MRHADTTISCRAFALIALVLVVSATAARGADRPPPPKLPIAEWWTVLLDGPVSAGPVAADGRIYLGMGSAHLTARDGADGHDLWRQDRDVVESMAAGGGLLFIATADAVEALHGESGKEAWILPRSRPVAPLMVAGDTLLVVTEHEVIAVRAASGEVIWRREAGGVKLAPAVDDQRIYVGADDGRLTALSLKDGSVAWDNKFFDGGITALAAYRGLVYVGAGDRRLYCLDGATKAKDKWSQRLGALVTGQMQVDDERVYLAALDNVVRAFDRETGNQRWQAPMRQRPSFGVSLSGHVVFVPGATNDIAMIYDRGGPSGVLSLPGQTPPGLDPSITDSPNGAIVYAVTGGLTNEWHLVKFAPAGESVLIPLSALAAMPGLPYLTDPRLVPIATSMTTLIMSDPPLRGWPEQGWPIVLRDPPLEPLTVLPGLQLRPLSPVLPVRPARPAPGG